MHQVLFLFLFIFCFLNLKAQTVNIYIHGMDNSNAVLSYLQGENIIFVDSIRSNDYGKFIYNYNSKKQHPGIYRLNLDKKRWIDFVYDGYEISLETDANYILDSIKVISSESNRLFDKFLKLNKVYNTKAELLQLMLARFPKEDKYYSQSKERLQELQNEYNTFINKTEQMNPTAFIAKYIRSAQLPIIDINIPIDKQLDYLKEHALDNVDFNDAELIFSDVFTDKTIAYLTYYRNPQLPKELLEKEFMKAVDTILNKAKVNDLVYQHIVEYLVDGFKKFGFDYVLDYIVENYVIKDDICLDVKTEGLIKKRINQAKFLQIGNKVPDIVLPDSTGKLIELNKIKSEKILIIFYASWCPHCQTLIPQVNKEYSKLKTKEFEVIAVSLDTSKTDWLNFISKHSLNWFNVSDLKGWDCKAASDFFLYATPTMFWVDKNRKIIGKPLTLEELNKLL